MTSGVPGRVDFRAAFLPTLLPACARRLGAAAKLADFELEPTAFETDMPVVFIAKEFVRLKRNVKYTAAGEAGFELIDGHFGRRVLHEPLLGDEMSAQFHCAGNPSLVE